MPKPILVTLTATSCAGKSYLFDFIRDVAKLPCLISTTTRKPRANEVHGRDYYFITEEESLELERTNQLAELAIYNGCRYGVTVPEFHSKLATGLAFLIVEPSGIDHYAKPATDIGAHHLKVWVDVPLATRLARFNERSQKDLAKAIGDGSDYEAPAKALNTILKRHTSMLTEEMEWYDMALWDVELNGTDTPGDNLDTIMKQVNYFKKRDA
jgi:guanylate kinase